MEAFDLTRHLRDRKLCYNLNVNIYNIWGDVLIEEYQTKDYSGYNNFISYYMRWIWTLQTGFKDISYSCTRSFDKGHGRKDTREYYVTEDIDWLSMRKEWKNLKSIGLAIRKSEQKGKITVLE